MNYENLQLREKVLIFMLILSIIGGAYYVFRWLPNAKKIAVLEEQKGFVDTQRKETKLPRISRKSKTYAITLSKVKTEHTELIKKLARVKTQYVSLKNDAELQNLRREISNLARNTGLTVLETHTVSAGANSEKIFKSILGVSQKRPQQVLTLRTRYSSLRRFLNNLNYLPWKVQVLSLNIAVADSESLGQIQPLDVQMILTM